MTSSNENIFRVIGPLWGESTGHRWFSLTKASDSELWCFLWSSPQNNGWVNNRDAGDLRRHGAYYYVTVTSCDRSGITRTKELFLSIGIFTDHPFWYFVDRLLLVANYHICPVPLWRHQMETFSALLAICAGNSPVTGEFPAQRPVTRSFEVFFDLRLNKRLSKQSFGWWFETPSRPLRRHSNRLPKWFQPARNFQCLSLVLVTKNQNRATEYMRWEPFVCFVVCS